MNIKTNIKNQNRPKVKISEKKTGGKRRTDFNFKLICNIRTRTNKVFRSPNNKKTNKAIDLIGCSQSFFKKWILHQLYGDMTEENYGSVWTIDHSYPLSKTNLSNENKMQKINILDKFEANVLQ